jgi:hypothetical protein
LQARFSGCKKAYVVKEATLILVASGIVLILGMAIVVAIVPKINRNYIFGGLNAVPFVFMVGGAAVACFAIYSLYRSRKSQLKLEDERR